MKPQWFYFRDGQSHGPVTMAEVRRMLKCERLKTTDYVRYFKDAEWMLVSEFLTIIASRRQLANLELDETEAELEEEPDDAESLAVQGGQLASESAFRVLSFGTRLWEMLTRLPELRRSWITVAALAAIAVAYFLQSIDLHWNETSETINQLLAIEEELALLQEFDTPADEWAEFQKRSRKTLLPLQQALERRARENPRLRSQYWTEWGYRQSVARAHLIQACLALRQLIDTRGGDGSQRANLNRRIDLAHVQTVYPATVTKSSSSSWDAITVGILCLDAVLVLCGAAYWWRRRMHRPQATQPSVPTVSSLS